MERKKKILANMQGNLIFPWLNNISRREYEGKQFFFASSISCHDIDRILDTVSSGKFLHFSNLNGFKNFEMNELNTSQVTRNGVIIIVYYK